MDSESVVISFNEPGKSFLFKEKDNDDYINVIVPFAEKKNKK
jgi:DNA polymerase III sliding clamp (beta) subunit (PCNA family)